MGSRFWGKIIRDRIWIFGQFLGHFHGGQTDTAWKDTSLFRRETREGTDQTMAQYMKEEEQTNRMRIRFLILRNTTRKLLLEKQRQDDYTIPNPIPFIVLSDVSEERGGMIWIPDGRHMWRRVSQPLSAMTSDFDKFEF